MLDPMGSWLQPDNEEVAVVQNILAQTSLGSSLDTTAADVVGGQNRSGMKELDLSAFERFLIKFMQDRVMRALEPYVANHALFVRLGGRDLSRLKREYEVSNSTAAMETVKTTLDAAKDEKNGDHPNQKVAQIIGTDVDGSTGKATTSTGEDGPFSAALADGREEWERKGAGEESALGAVRLDLSGVVSGSFCIGMVALCMYLCSLFTTVSGNCYI